MQTNLAIASFKLIRQFFGCFHRFEVTAIKITTQITTKIILHRIVIGHMTFYNYPIIGSSST